MSFCRKVLVTVCAVFIAAATASNVALAREVSGLGSENAIVGSVS